MARLRQCLEDIYWGSKKTLMQFLRKNVFPIHLCYICLGLITFRTQKWKISSKLSSFEAVVPPTVSLPRRFTSWRRCILGLGIVVVALAHRLHTLWRLDRPRRYSFGVNESYIFSNFLFSHHLDRFQRNLWPLLSMTSGDVETVATMLTNVVVLVLVYSVSAADGPLTEMYLIFTRFSNNFYIISHRQRGR